MDSPAIRANDQLTLVIPVYNEGANFPALWDAVSSQIRSPFRALVVYDFNEDNTVPVVQQIIATARATKWWLPAATCAADSCWTRHRSRA